MNEAAFKAHRYLFGKLSYLPAEFICVLVVISMKINQQEAQLPLGIIQCLSIKAEEVKLQGLQARGKHHAQDSCDTAQQHSPRATILLLAWF